MSPSRSGRSPCTYPSSGPRDHAAATTGHPTRAGCTAGADGCSTCAGSPTGRSTRSSPSRRHPCGDLRDRGTPAAPPCARRLLRQALAGPGPGPGPRPPRPGRRRTRPAEP
ncbi:hypothetical protein O7622_12580 [Micromonospora sp. WMMD1076]|nr:hypothetical protein [Micromonospora sp. WMMD1076]WFF09997.1 hypothetical protein O7622_12580 [Micromonospora sp. WMMD1076]